MARENPQQYQAKLSYLGRSVQTMNTDEELVRVAEIEKHIAALQAEQSRLIAAIADDPREGTPAPVLEKEYFREELRALLGESAVAIADRIETARALVHRLPLTLAALETGDVTMRHARALCDAVAGLPECDAAAVEQACVPFAAGRDYTAFSRKIRREVAALDSRTVAERLAAALADRRVWCIPDAATATFGAVLPADGAQTVMTAINQAAESYPAGDARTRDQRRADGLVQVAQDWLAGLATTDRHVGPSIQVTVAASTLLGVDNQPGELDGHGPIPAALARAIAADQTGTWRRLVTDEQGRLLDYGRTRYRPPTALAEFVMARDRECQFPGCHRRAEHAELDHRIAWADGGTTNADNLICLCTRHHHAKHEAGWSVEQTADGTLRWTSPAGLVYDNHRVAYPVGVVQNDNIEALPAVPPLVA